MLNKGSDGIIIAILSAVVDKPDGMMGKEIISEVRSELPKVNASTLYPLLRQMQSDGYLDVFQKEDQGGRSRSFYKITDSGREELRAIEGEGESAVSEPEEVSDSSGEAESPAAEAEESGAAGEGELKLEPIPEPEIRVAAENEQQTEDSLENGNDEEPETVDSGVSDDGNVSVQINHVNAASDENENERFDEPVETVWTPAANAEEEPDVPDADIPEDIQNFEFEENEENGGHPAMQMEEEPAPSDDFGSGFTLTGNMDPEQEPQVMDGNETGSGLFDMDDFDTPSDEGDGYGLGLDISDYNQITTMEEQLFRSQGDLDSDNPVSDSDLGEVPSVTLDDSEMAQAEQPESEGEAEAHEVNPRDGAPDLPELENLLSSIKSQEEGIKEERKEMEAAKAAPVQQSVPVQPVQSRNVNVPPAQSQTAPAASAASARRGSGSFREVRNPGTEENVNSLVDLLKSNEPKKKSFFGRFGGSNGNKKSQSSSQKAEPVNAAPAAPQPASAPKQVSAPQSISAVKPEVESRPAAQTENVSRPAQESKHSGASAQRFVEVRHPESDQTVDSLVDLLRNDEPKKKSSLFGRFGGKKSGKSAPAPAASAAPAAPAGQSSASRSVAKRNSAPVPQMSRNVPPVPEVTPAVSPVQNVNKPAESQAFKPAEPEVPAKDEYVINTDNVSTAGASEGIGADFPVAEESREVHSSSAAETLSSQYSQGERRHSLHTAASVRRAEEQDAAIDSLADLLGGDSRKNTVHLSGKPSTVKKFVPKSSSDAAAGKMPAKSVDEKEAGGARPVETRATITKPLEAKAVATNPGQTKQAEVKETSSSAVIKSEKLAEQIKETREAKKKAEEAASIESFRERLMREHLIPDEETDKK